MTESNYTTVPDCLVLKLEEVECGTNKKDTTIYVFYDKEEHKYVVRGQRKVTKSHKSCT